MGDIGVGLEPLVGGISDIWFTGVVTLVLDGHADWVRESQSDIP